jgi:hypothetical protein
MENLPDGTSERERRLEKRNTRASPLSVDNVPVSQDPPLSPNLQAANVNDPVESDLVFTEEKDASIGHGNNEASVTGPAHDDAATVPLGSDPLRNAPANPLPVSGSNSSGANTQKVSGDRGFVNQRSNPVHDASFLNYGESHDQFLARSNLNPRVMPQYHPGLDSGNDLLVNPYLSNPRQRDRHHSHQGQQDVDIVPDGDFGTVDSLGPFPQHASGEAQLRYKFAQTQAAPRSQLFSNPTDQNPFEQSRQRPYLPESQWDNYFSHYTQFLQREMEIMRFQNAQAILELEKKLNDARAVNTPNTLQGNQMSPLQPTTIEVTQVSADPVQKIATLLGGSELGRPLQVSLATIAAFSQNPAATPSKIADFGNNPIYALYHLVATICGAADMTVTSAEQMAAFSWARMNLGLKSRSYPHGSYSKSNNTIARDFIVDFLKTCSVESTHLVDAWLNVLRTALDQPIPLTAVENRSHLVKLIERRAAAILLATQVWLPLLHTDINVTAEQMTPPAIEVERIADRIFTATITAAIGNPLFSKIDVPVGFADYSLSSDPSSFYYDDFKLLVNLQSFAATKSNNYSEKVISSSSSSSKWSKLLPTLPHETNNVFSTISSPFLTPGTVSKLGDLAPGEITPPPTHIATDTILKNLANHPNCIIGNPFEVRILASSTNLPAVGSCAPSRML